MAYQRHEGEFCARTLNCENDAPTEASDTRDFEGGEDAAGGVGVIVRYMPASRALSGWPCGGLRSLLWHHEGANEEALQG
jgi:hypothetical protein